MTEINKLSLEDTKISQEDQKSLEEYFKRNDPELKTFKKYLLDRVFSLRDLDTMNDVGAFTDAMIARDVLAREMAKNVLLQILSSIEINTQDVSKNKTESYK